MSYNAKAEKIALRAICFFMLSCILDYFRCHVAHRSATFVGFGCDCVIQIERKTEINDEWLEISEIDEYVLRL
jgi:hypothetical protein